MKNLIFTAVFLLSVLSVSAQQKWSVESQYPGDEKASNEFSVALDKQQNEKTSALRTTWVASRPSSNWFITAKVGMGGVISEKAVNVWAPWKWFDSHSPNYWHPAYGIGVGKWLSPVWGIRADLDYGHEESFDENGVTNGSSRNYALTANFLVNLKHLFLPYNPKGFFNPVFNLGVGALETTANATWNPGPSKNNTFWNVAEKAGLQLNFRLCDALNIFIEGQLWAVPSNFDQLVPAREVTSSFGGNTDFLTIGTLGLTYNFGWKKFIKTPFRDPAEIDALNKEINDLRNRPEKVCPPCPPVPECPPAAPVEKPVELDPIFFTINSASVRDNQLINVAKAAEYLIDHPASKLELASYADKNTGTAKYNMQLSKRRSEAVAKVLTTKFGIAKDRLILKYYGDTVQPFSDNDQNRVTMFIK